MILKAYKYRIYPNQEQSILINKHFGCVRYIYNWGLESKIKEYQVNKKNLSCLQLCNQLPKLKKEFEWLQEVSAQSLQMSLRNLDNAYTKFFKQTTKFPKFKKKLGRQSFQCPQQNKIDFETNTLSVLKIKNIKIKIDRKFEGKIKTVTISKTSTNKYYASILVETKESPKIKSKPDINQAIGIDLGIKHFVTLSNGEKIENPKYLEKSMDKLKLFHRRLSRKTKGGKNREKAKLKLAKLYEKITNQRIDFLHKLSTRLIRENQSICLEDLNISGMLKNHKLAKSISSASWHIFVNMLKYKTEWYGVNILQIGRFDPSSKMCTCGKINKDLKLKDRTWICDNCNISHDRDVLAANNIKNFAFDRQSLLKNRVGYTRINAQGDDKLHALAGGHRRTEKLRK